MNTVLMLLKDNILNVIIIGFFLSVWASWKIARWSKGVDASLKRTEQCLDRLEETVHRIDARVDALSTRVDTLSTRVDTISQKVDALYHIFMVFLGHRVERTTSPRTLTDYGTKLSLEIDAPSLAAHYAAGLRDKIGSMNAWQIQELCFNHAENEIMNDLQQHDIDRYNQITMCACREGIELSQVMRVVGLVMRDQLLRQAGQLPRAQIALALPGDDPTHAISPPDPTDRESRQPKQ